MSYISDTSAVSYPRAVFAERPPSLFQYLHFYRLRIRSCVQCVRALIHSQNSFATLTKCIYFHFQ